MNKLTILFLLCMVMLGKNAVAQTDLALNFDGTNDYVSTSNTQNLTSALTLEGYFKASAFGNYMVLISKSKVWAQANSDFPASLWIDPTGHFYFALSMGNDLNYDAELTSGPIALNTWYHVAAVYQANQSVELYVNGTLVDSEPITFTISSTSYGWALGRPSVETGGGIGAYLFNGSMDEVRIWDVARTEAQIQGNITCPLTLPQSGLVAYYDFNNPLATVGGNNAGQTTLTDNTGNGNTGTLNNFALTGTASNWVLGSLAYYADVDNDGFGDPLNPLSLNCTPIPSGYVLDNSDCNDNNNSIPSTTAFSYRTAQSGNWTSASTWEKFDGCAWSPAFGGPSSADNDINIRDGHSVTLSGINLSIDQATVESGGTLTLTNATLTLNAASAIVFNAGSVFNLSNGTLNSNGTLEIQAGATFNQTGLLSMFPNAILNNYGTWNWSAGGIDYTNGGTPTINNHGTLNLSTDADVSMNNFQAGNFNNTATGIINKTGSAFDETSFNGGNNSVLNFSNAGTININSGKLNFSSAFTNSGALNIAAGATVRFTGNINAGFTPGTTFSGTGSINLEKTPFISVNFTTPVTISGTLNLISGRITGDSNLTMDGVSFFNWIGGYLEMNAALNINSNALFTMTAADCDMLATQVINNYGTWNWSAGGFSSSGGQNTTVNNYGTWNITGCPDPRNFLVANFGSTAFFNYGTINIDAPGYWQANGNMSPFDFSFTNVIPAVVNINACGDLTTRYLQCFNLFTPLCPGTSFTIPYKTPYIFSFNTGNVFTAQLSDASGSFAFPVDIGTVSSTASGTITGTIPISTPAGTGYRIRLTSSSPVVAAIDNGTNITIQSPTTFYADADNDGFGDAALSTLACSQPSDYVSNDDDCNDANNAVNPNATEICNSIDDDCDGSIDEGFDLDSDGFTTCNGDCDDSDSAINPSSLETCNGWDDNCDGSIDEGFDLDNDGFTVCENDCDDSDPSVKPDATEICNFIDDDCDGSIDEGFDLDGDGFTICENDCDDGNPFINPGEVELLCNNIDDDCDGTIDEGRVNGCMDVLACNYNSLATCSDGSCTYPFTLYLDDDGDGFGDNASSLNACTHPANYVADNTDCDDSNALVNPSAPELLCNNIDDDCDGTIDEGRVDGCMDVLACNYNSLATCDDGSCTYPFTLYLDDDGDGFGDLASPLTACTHPANYVGDATDCDDTNPFINPSATELFCNNMDDDCDGTIDEGRVNGCMDVVACNFNPLATCENGSCTYAFTLYLDNDGDGFGDNNSPLTACTHPLDYVSDNTDCDDTDADVNPGESELLCNYIDDDCDGTIDEGRVNGCTDVAACNFNALATCEDASCEYCTCNDADNDGLNDCEEASLGTDPNDSDSDDDGLSDGEEVNNTETNPLDNDTDDDGLSDGEEVLMQNTNPLDPDTDDDGLSDGDEVLQYGTNPLDPDSDGDGLNDGDEVLNQSTDPLDPDTDDDGLSDGNEVNIYNTYPLLQDTDGDGLTDGAEANYSMTDPNDTDTDDDGCFDLADVMGDCEILGCTYVDALNFNPSATVDDGSCICSPTVNDCPADLDGNGVVNVSDLLLFMADFGTFCP